GADVGLGKRAASGQAIQDGAKALLQAFEHRPSFHPGFWFNPGGNASAWAVQAMPKPKSTRGRIALPGVGLRDRLMPQGVPVGCSEWKLVAEFGVLTQENAVKVKRAGLVATQDLGFSQQSGQPRQVRFAAQPKTGRFR